MKTIIILTMLLIASLAYGGPFLACDLPASGTTITQTKVEITTNPGPSQTVMEVAGTVTVRGTDFILYDLGTLTAGKYRFRARWAEVGGLWSEYSDPFDLGKPGKPGGLRIAP